jgi:hypothetical protein
MDNGFSITDRLSINPDIVAAELATLVFFQVGVFQVGLEAIFISLLDNPFNSVKHNYIFIHEQYPFVGQSNMGGAGA